MKAIWRSLWLTLALTLGLAAISEGASDIGAFINSRTSATTLAGTEKFPCTQGSNTTVQCLISQIGAWLTSGSTTWTGSHANVPRQTLTVSGTTFTPPSSFGNYWLTTSAASQTIACPTSIADGDTFNLHIQQGASAPFSPNISFANPCYAWASATAPTLSTTANKVDDFFCSAMSPADVTGASAVCGAQLAAAPPALAPAIVQTGSSFGGGTGVTSKVVTLTGVNAADTIRLGIFWCFNNSCSAPGGTNVSSVAVTTGTGSCAVITGTASVLTIASPGVQYRCTSLAPSAGTIAITITWSANSFFQAIAAAEISNDNGVEAGNVATGSASPAAVTSGTLSQATNEMVLAAVAVVNGPTVNSIASPFTLIQVGGAGSGLAFGWALSSGSTSGLAASFTLSGSGGWAANISGVNHP